MRKKPPVPFAQKFRNADPLALWLLERLLAFDPKDNLTAKEEIMRHKLVFLETQEVETTMHWTIIEVMVEEGFWTENNVMFTAAWLQDLVAVGYQQPRLLSWIERELELGMGIGRS